MHKIITLILAISLYAPNMASLLAFSECEITAILNKKPDCDCKLSNNPQQNTPTNLPDKHKEIVQQTDWKYIVTHHFLSKPVNGFMAIQNFHPYQISHYKYLFGLAIFHPPCC